MTHSLTTGSGTSGLCAILALIGLVLVACATSSKVAPQEPYTAIVGNGVATQPGGRRVLFVGNSHTYVHDVPYIVQQLVPGGAPPLAFDALTAPARSLAWHVEQGDVANCAAKRSYDTVVLQPNSIELVNGAPIDDARALEAQANGAQVLLWQTWPRHPVRNEYAAERGVTMEQWEQVTMKNALAIGRPISPIGRVWVCVHRETGLDLWDPDGNHASHLGAYVAALTLHRSLYGADVSWTDFVPPGVRPNAARTARAATARCLSR